MANDLWTTLSIDAAPPGGGTTSSLNASATASAPNFTLQLLHLADGEAGLLAPRTAPNLAALVDAFDGQYANTLILAGGDNWLPGPFLAAGTDPSVIPTLNRVSGSTIGAASNVPIGAVDIAIHNAIGVEASAIGNHEFDLGSRVFRDTFTPGAGWAGADFVHVTANLDFSGDPDLAPRFTDTVGNGVTPTPEASTLKGRIVPAAIVTEGGERIGIVGATTQILEAISSPSGTEVKGFPTGTGPNGERDDMDLLAAQLQPVIDELIAEGVNKIVLQAHLQQIGNEKLLASKLKGVDIILSAGSNTRLGDADDEAVAFPGHAADFADTYPLVITNAEGKPTLIVNTDNEYTYLGRLVVEFDANGDIVLDSLAANQAINGAYASTAENVAEAWGTTVDNLDATAFAEGTKGDKVRDLTDAVQNVIRVKDANVYGFSHVYLEGERAFVRSEETNLGSLSADANAEALQDALGIAANGSGGTFVVSLKNGGGIRAQIGTVSPPNADGTVDKLPPPANAETGKPAGGVSQLDVENSLRFDNKLMAVDVSAADLKAILEHGVAAWPNQGRFPQIGGVEFSWDPDLPPGSRVRDIALVDEGGTPLVGLYDDGVLLAGAPATITVVTLNFLANGGDGYPIKTLGENFRFLLDDGTLSAPVNPALTFTAPGVVPTNALGEQQAFREYMHEFHATPDRAYAVADTSAALDERIQNLNFRAEDVLAGVETQSVRFAEGSREVVQAEGTGADTAFAFTVERSGGTRGDVAFTVELGSATATGADFAAGGALPRTLSGVIKAGETSATLTLLVAGDALPEGDEGFSLVLTEP
jgi:2',3'-cyclic-nucleotide 2'-phosphodiesterase (5'-nucleotidase family)